MLEICCVACNFLNSLLKLFSPQNQGRTGVGDSARDFRAPHFGYSVPGLCVPRDVLCPGGCSAATPQARPAREVSRPCPCVVVTTGSALPDQELLTYRAGKGGKRSSERTLGDPGKARSLRPKPSCGFVDASDFLPSLRVSPEGL